MKIERQTLAQQVLDQLILRLMASPLQRGQRVSTEQELMEEFGVSRSSVREAVKTLQNLGILESRPAWGTFLSSKKNTCSRLFLLASLLSRDSAQVLQQFSQTLSFHSLSALQRDLKLDGNEEVQQVAQQHLLQLETCIDNVIQLRLAAPGSKGLLNQQDELVRLLFSYPNECSLISRIGTGLEEFLTDRQGGSVQFSQALMDGYQNLVAAISQGQAQLLSCRNRLLRILKSEETVFPEAILEEV